MKWEERIALTPGVSSGKPCIRGTLMTVYDVLEYLAGDMSEEEILDDFPSLSREDIRACLAFAAVRERRLAAGVLSEGSRYGACHALPQPDGVRST